MEDSIGILTDQDAAELFGLEMTEWERVRDLALEEYPSYLKVHSTRFYGGRVYDRWALEAWAKRRGLLKTREADAETS